MTDDEKLVKYLKQVTLDLHDARGRLRRRRIGSLSPLRLWVWVVGIRVVRIPLRGCGSWLLMVVMAFRGSRPTVAGTSTHSTIPILVISGPAPPVRDGFLTTRASSTPVSSGSARGGAGDGSPAAPTAGKRRGRRSRTRASIPPVARQSDRRLCRNQLGR